MMKKTSNLASYPNNEILLSICIPTYNRAEWVSGLVLECLKINSDKIEIIVIDNCSPDNTQALLNEIKDPRFYYYRNSINTGFGNIGSCVNKGRGKFCLLLRDKDRVIPNIENWFNQVESFLEKSEDTTIFRGLQQEADGTVIHTANKILKKNTLEAYKNILLSSTYSTSIIFPKKTVSSIFDEAKNSAPYLWSLYPFVNLLYFCAKYGDIVPMESLLVQMPSVKDKNVFKNINDNDIYKNPPKYFSGDGDLPYWTPISRKKQVIDTARLFKKLNLPGEIIVPLLVTLFEKMYKMIEGSFGFTKLPWDNYIPNTFPKFHYWHYIFWESFFELSAEIRSLYGIPIADISIDLVFQHYKYFCNLIANRELQEVHSLFFTKKS